MCQRSIDWMRLQPIWENQETHDLNEIFKDLQKFSPVKEAIERFFATCKKEGLEENAEYEQKTGDHRWNRVGHKKQHLMQILKTFAKAMANLPSRNPPLTKFEIQHWTQTFNACVHFLSENNFVGYQDWVVEAIIEAILKFPARSSEPFKRMIHLDITETVTGKIYDLEEEVDDKLYEFTDEKLWELSAMITHKDHVGNPSILLDGETAISRWKNLTRAVERIGYEEWENAADRRWKVTTEKLVKKVTQDSGQIGDRRGCEGPMTK